MNRYNQNGIWESKVAKVALQDLENKISQINKRKRKTNKNTIPTSKGNATSTNRFSQVWNNNGNLKQGAKFIEDCVNFYRK